MSGDLAVTGVAEEQAWQEFWADGDGGEAVGGDQRHKLAACWQAFFSAGAVAVGAPIVVDVAAGRGVALKAAMDAADQPGFYVAIDYSPAAVASAKRALGAASGVAADAARLPLRDGVAQVVISQFGIEYAGFGAFAEAARILGPGGRFCSISHYSGGAIDHECAENLRLLEALVGTSLFAAARSTLEASFNRRSRRDPKPIDAALDGAFAGALGRAASHLRAAPASAARATLERFIADLTRLSARRFAFEPREAFDWLAGMEASLDAYRKRMHSMRASALDRARLAEVAARFAAAGLVEFRAEPLLLDDNRPPAAWVIEARRPAL